jgi:hypothetical protein
MYSDWLPDIAMAIEIGCEAIGFVFIVYFHANNPYGSNYSWLSIFVEGTSPENLRIDKQKWLDFREVAIKYKKEIKMDEYLRPNELQAVYDALGLKAPYHYQTPNLFVVGEKDPNRLVTWADMDAVEEQRMKALIKGFKTVGALPATFPEWPNIKYDAEGKWISNWLDYAKSNPKPKEQ